jgi:H+/gluconate symporter-like permease
MQLIGWLQIFANAVFFGMGIIFMLLGVSIMVVSAWNFFHQDLICENCNVLQELLNFVGYLIMAVAIFDVGQYLLEERAFKEKIHRTTAEMRQSLTRIVAIIVIAISLDALLNVLKASSLDMRLLVYPSILFLAAVSLLVGLGLYQRFSSLAEKDLKKPLPRRTE